jgi:hypothetical protein
MIFGEYLKMDASRVRRIVEFEPHQFAQSLISLNKDEIFQLEQYLRARIEETFNPEMIKMMRLLDYNVSINKLQIALFNDAHTKRVRLKIAEYTNYLHITLRLIDWLLIKWKMIDGDSGLVEVNMMFMDHYRSAIAKLAEDAVNYGGGGDTIFSYIADMINRLPPIPRIIALVLGSVIIYVVAANIGGKENAKYAMQYMASMSGCDTSNLEKPPSMMTLGMNVFKSFMGNGMSSLITGNATKSAPPPSPYNPPQASFTTPSNPITPYNPPQASFTAPQASFTAPSNPITPSNPQASFNPSMKIESQIQNNKSPYENDDDDLFID